MNVGGHHKVPMANLRSVLDLSETSTPKSMDALGQLFEVEMTNRNWNTVNRIADKLN